MTPVGQAADACAQKTLAEYTQKSPLLAAALATVPRNVMLCILASCFIEGSIYASERIVGEVVKGQ